MCTPVCRKGAVQRCRKHTALHQSHFFAQLVRFVHVRGLSRKGYPATQQAGCFPHIIQMSDSGVCCVQIHLRIWVLGLEGVTRSRSPKLMCSEALIERETSTNYAHSYTTHTHFHIHTFTAYNTSHRCARFLAHSCPYTCPSACPSLSPACSCVAPMCLRGVSFERVRAPAPIWCPSAHSFTHSAERWHALRPPLLFHARSLVCVVRIKILRYTYIHITLS